MVVVLSDDHHLLEVPLVQDDDEVADDLLDELYISLQKHLQTTEPYKQTDETEETDEMGLVLCDMDDEEDDEVLDES